MNGDCHEGYLIRMLDQARRGERDAEGLAELWSAAPRLRWMEEEEPLKTLQRQQANKRVLGAGENFIIFLRLVELLCRDGFFSPLYQQLISEPLARRAVEQECTAGHWLRFKALCPISPKCGGHFFFESATYLTAEGFDRLCSGRDLMALAGTEALAWFVEALFVEGEARIETVECIPDALRERFLLLARLVMIGIAADSDSFRRHSFMERLLLSARRFGRCTVGDIEVWLQRRAFLRHAQRHPEWTDAYRSPARPLLYAYCAARTGLAMEKRLSLAMQIEHSLRRGDFWEAEGAEAVALLRRL